MHFQREKEGAEESVRQSLQREPEFLGAMTELPVCVSCLLKRLVLFPSRPWEQLGKSWSL